METHEPLEHWVRQRMAAVQAPPGWPDAHAGWSCLDRRIARAPVPLSVWAGAAVTLCLAILALPGPRVAAQILWDRVVVGRIQVMLVDHEGPGAAAAFFTPEVYRRPDTRPVSSLDEAIDAAGFVPRFPEAGVFSGAPTYSVADTTAARVRLSAPAIRYLVHQAGGSAAEVPDAWNGAILELRIGPVIVADYNGVLLLQSLPFELIKPADLDLARFYRLAFQALGMSRSEATAMSTDLVVSPALLMVMPAQDRDLVHEFSTKGGKGLMIEEVYGPGKVAAVWTGNNRIYALFPAEGEVTREFVSVVANALD